MLDPMPLLAFEYLKWSWTVDTTWTDSDANEIWLCAEGEPLTDFGLQVKSNTVEDIAILQMSQPTQHGRIEIVRSEDRTHTTIRLSMKVESACSSNASTQTPQVGTLSLGQQGLVGIALRTALLRGDHPALTLLLSHDFLRGLVANSALNQLRTFGCLDLAYRTVEEHHKPYANRLLDMIETAVDELLNAKISMVNWRAGLGEHLATILDRIGASGDADKVRKKTERGQPQLASDMWLPSKDTIPTALSVLAEALYRHQVTRLVKNPVTMPRAFQLDVATMFSHGKVRLDHDLPGQQVIPFPEENKIRRVGLLPDSTLTALTKEMRLLGHVTPQRVFLRILFDVWRAWWAEDPDFRVVVYKGDTELAKKCGAGNSKKAITEVRNAVDILSSTELFAPPDRWFNLFAKQREGATHRARLEIMAGTAIVPYSGKVVAKGMTRTELWWRHALQLTPALPFPPVTGHWTTHGAQGALCMHLVRHLRRKAHTMFEGEDERNGVVLTIKDKRALADLAGLPRDIATNLIDDHWRSDHDDGKAIVLVNDDKTVRLGTYFKPEWDTIRDGGAIEVGARSRAIRYQRNKRKRFGF